MAFDVAAFALDERFHDQRWKLYERKAELLKSAGQLHEVDAEGFLQPIP